MSICYAQDAGQQPFTYQAGVGGVITARIRFGSLTRHRRVKSHVTFYWSAVVKDVNTRRFRVCLSSFSTDFAQALLGGLGPGLPRHGHRRDAQPSHPGGGWVGAN